MYRYIAHTAVICRHKRVEPDDVPRVGTFYDFINKLWKLDTNNISSHIKFPKSKPSNPPKKGDKAASIEKIL